MLSGCAAPMNQREAEVWALRGLGHFCREHPCAQVRLMGAERVGTRWLVDYESAASRYTVAVDDGGNAEVSIWDKNAPG